MDPDHQSTLASKHNLAYVYHFQGKYDLAEPLFKDVLQAKTATLGADHPDTLASKFKLATLYQEQGKYDLADSLLKETLQGQMAKLGAEHPQTMLTMPRLGLNLLRQKKYAEAEPILREFLAIEVKKQPDQWTTFDTRSMLGEALLGQKKYAEAEPLLVQGYDGMKERQKSIPPQSKARLIEGLERLVQLYDAWGKKDQADDYRHKLTAEGGKPQENKK